MPRAVTLPADETLSAALDVGVAAARAVAGGVAMAPSRRRRAAVFGVACADDRREREPLPPPPPDPASDSAVEGTGVATAPSLGLLKDRAPSSSSPFIHGWPEMSVMVARASGLVRSMLRRRSVPAHAHTQMDVEPRNDSRDSTHSEALTLQLHRQLVRNVKVAPTNALTPQ
jgi:hypothetical protein